MVRFFNFTLMTALAVTTLFLAVGYLGALHPAFDSISVFRVYAVGGLVVTLLMLLLFRKWRSAAFALSAVMLGGLTFIPDSVDFNNNHDSIVLLQSNLNFRNHAVLLGPHADMIGADIITVQEVTQNSRPALQSMREYPSQIFCEFASVGGVAILSRFREVKPASHGCAAGMGLTWMRVETSGGPLTIVSIHLHWPWPYGQAGQLQELLPVIESLPQPVIIGGDFNMVPWSHSIALIERASGAGAINGIRHSLAIMDGLIHLPIDHILIPDGADGVATLGPQLGSDHHSISAIIKLAP